MKQNLVSEERVIEKVKESIGASLRINPGSITPESSLVEDLGAESLDFLDINYRLEQTFGIKMARYFVLEHAEEMFGEGTVLDPDGKLTERGAKLLEIRLGDQDRALRPGMALDQINALVTVRSLARGVMDILDSLPQNCPHCASAAWRSDDGAVIRCGSCGKDASFSSGDNLIQAWLTKLHEEKSIF